MTRIDDRITDRTLELRIIRAAADLARGGSIMTTMHDIREATAELVQRHPEGYPASNAPWSAPWPWNTETPEQRLRTRARCVPGRPETWPADLETATCEALDKAVAPGHPRIPVHNPFGPRPEPDEEYRDRLRAESLHDIGRIHGRVLDVAEHMWNAIAPKGEYPATSASRALAVGIITAVFEEIERTRGPRAEYAYREGDEVEYEHPTDGWIQGVVRNPDQRGIAVYRTHPYGTSSCPFTWAEARELLRRRGEYRVGDEVEVNTGHNRAIWEPATITEAHDDAFEVRFKHRNGGGLFSRDKLRRPTRP